MALSRFDLPDSLPPVFVDQIQIQQILLDFICKRLGWAVSSRARE
jgi:hypothetical protein